jgi:ATP-dependent DNA ligase
VKRNGGEGGILATFISHLTEFKGVEALPQDAVFSAFSGDAFQSRSGRGDPDHGWNELHPVTSMQPVQLKRTVSATTRERSISLLSSLPKRKAEFIEPMDCAPVTKLADGPEWVFEIKLDGYRAIAVKADGRVRWNSR